MTESNGTIVISRHGKKYSGMHGKNKEDGGKKVIPASLEDKAFIYITPEGAQELKEKGKETLGDQECDNTLLMTSDFIRAFQSALYFVSEAHLKNRPYLDQRLELGLSINNINWKHPLMPAYSNEKQVLDNYVITLFEKFYFQPTEKGLPFMANMTYHFIKSIGDGIEYLQRNKKKEQNLLAHFTHGPNVDTLTMIALDCLKIDPKHRVVEVKTDTYQGHVAMGEMFTGQIYNLSSDNPSIELNVKGGDVGYKLSDLRNLERTIQEQTEG